MSESGKRPKAIDRTPEHSRCGKMFHERIAPQIIPMHGNGSAVSKRELATVSGGE